MNSSIFGTTNRVFVEDQLLSVHDNGKGENPGVTTESAFSNQLPCFPIGLHNHFRCSCENTRLGRV